MDTTAYKEVTVYIEISDPVGSATCTSVTKDPVNLPYQLAQVDPATNTGNATIETFDLAPPNLEISCVNHTQDTLQVYEVMVTGRSN
jgi:hypothetical protein